MRVYTNVCDRCKKRLKTPLFDIVCTLIITFGLYNLVKIPYESTEGFELCRECSNEFKKFMLKED